MTQSLTTARISRLEQLMSGTVAEELCQAKVATLVITTLDEP